MHVLYNDGSMDNLDKKLRLQHSLLAIIASLHLPSQNGGKIRIRGQFK